MANLTYTIIDAADTSLNKTSVLVTGETEALVVDAAFTRADGHRIVAAVLDSGKRLTTVVITAGDPDFYFGAEVIADAFPEAVFLAPTDVIEHIQHSYEGKLQAWAHLGPNLPTRLVDLTPLTEPTPDRRRNDDRGTPGKRPARRPRLVPLRARLAIAVRWGAALRGPARVDRRLRDTRAAGRVDQGARRSRGARTRRTSSPATGSPAPRQTSPPSPTPATTSSTSRRPSRSSADAAEAEAALDRGLPGRRPEDRRRSRHEGCQG